MSRRNLGLLAVIAVALSTAAAAQMGGGMGGMGQGGMGPGGGMGGHGGRGQGEPSSGEQRPTPPREAKPLKRDKLDKPVTAMFRAADANGDGLVTLDELRGVIDARRDALIRTRFQRVDRDGNGQISLAEFTAWQRGLGSVALSDAQAGGASGGPVPEVIAPELGRDETDRALALVIEPLSATVIAAANTNYDAGLSPDELLAYERARFDKADLNHDGELSPDELRLLEHPDDRRLPRGPGGPGDEGPRGGRRQPD